MSMVPNLIERIRKVRVSVTDVTDERIVSAVRKARAEAAPALVLLRGQIGVTGRAEAACRRDREAAEAALPTAEDRSKLPFILTLAVMTYSFAVVTNFAALTVFPMPDWLRAIFAGLFGVISVTAGWAWHESRSARDAEGTDRSHRFAVGLLCLALAGSIVLAWARATDLFREAVGAGVIIDAGLDRMLRGGTVVLTCIAIAAEIATAFAVEQVLKAGGPIPIFRFSRLCRREDRLGLKLARLKAEREALRQKPRIVEADLRARQAVRRREQEATETLRVTVPAGPSTNGSGRNAQTSPTVESRRVGRRRRPLPPRLKRGLVSAAIVATVIVGTILLYLFAAPPAHAEPVRGLHVVLLDTSASISPGQFVRYLAAVEADIDALPEKARLVVFQIAEQSFGQAPIFEAERPGFDAYWNRTGAQARTWTLQTRERWKTVSAMLAPRAACSDVLGGVKRVQLDFAESRAAEKKLSILSDLRHASCDGRINLGLPPENPVAILADLQSRGLIPDLTGVRVHAYGVHTEQFTPQQWDRLRAFWIAFFERSRAVVAVYSPNFERMARR